MYDESTDEEEDYGVCRGLGGIHSPPCQNPSEYYREHLNITHLITFSLIVNTAMNELANLKSAPVRGKASFAGLEIRSVLTSRGQCFSTLAGL